MKLTLRTLAPLILICCLAGCSPRPPEPVGSPTDTPTPVVPPKIAGPAWSLQLLEQAGGQMELIRVRSSGDVLFHISGRPAVDLPFHLDNERTELLDRLQATLPVKDWKAPSDEPNVALTREEKVYSCSPARAGNAELLTVLRALRPKPGSVDSKELWICGKSMHAPDGAGILVETEKQKYYLEPTSALMMPGMVVAVAGHVHKGGADIAMAGPEYLVSSWVSWPLAADTNLPAATPTPAVKPTPAPHPKGKPKKKTP